MKRAHRCQCGTLLSTWESNNCQYYSDCHVCDEPYPITSQIKLFPPRQRWKVTARKRFRNTPPRQPTVADLVFPGDLVTCYDSCEWRKQGGLPHKGTVRSVDEYSIILDGIAFRIWTITYYSIPKPSIKGLGYSVQNELVAIDGKILHLFVNHDGWVEVEKQPTASRQLSLF